MFYIFVAMSCLVIVQCTGQGMPSLSGRHLRVVTVHRPPYVHVNDTIGGTFKQYSGYLVDLLEQLQRRLGFTYDIYLAPDGEFGTQNFETGAWSGVIGELANGRADVGLSHLTVLYNRTKVVSFSTPIQHGGISILYKIPKGPLPFTNLAELHASGVKYGTIRGGTKYRFFLDSPVFLWHRMGLRMEANQDSLPVNMEEALNKTLNENFAFLGETSELEYYTSIPPCRLMKISTMLGMHELSLAFQHNSDLTEKFSEAILMMRDEGKMGFLRSQWWKDSCPHEDQLRLCWCSNDAKFW